MQIFVLQCAWIRLYIHAHTVQHLSSYFGWHEEFQWHKGIYFTYIIYTWGNLKLKLPVHFIFPLIYYLVHKMYCWAWWTWDKCILFTLLCSYLSLFCWERRKKKKKRAVPRFAIAMAVAFPTPLLAPVIMKERPATDTSRSFSTKRLDADRWPFLQQITDHCIRSPADRTSSSISA